MPLVGAVAAAGAATSEGEAVAVGAATLIVGLTVMRPTRADDRLWLAAAEPLSDAEHTVEPGGHVQAKALGAVMAVSAVASRKLRTFSCSPVVTDLQPSRCRSVAGLLQRRNPAE